MNKFAEDCYSRGISCRYPRMDGKKTDITCSVEDLNCQTLTSGLFAYRLEDTEELLVYTLEVGMNVRYCFMFLQLTGIILWNRKSKEYRALEDGSCVTDLDWMASLIQLDEDNCEFQTWEWDACESTPIKVSADLPRELIGYVQRLRDTDTVTVST